MNEIEDRIRSLHVSQLRILKTLSAEADGILSSKEIADTTGSSATTFGALVSSLARFKDKNGQPLVVKVGRNDDGLRWKLNEKVIERQKLLEILADTGENY